MLGDLLQPEQRPYSGYGSKPEDINPEYRLGEAVLRE